MSRADRRILRSNLYPMIRHTIKSNKFITSWKEALTMMHYYSIPSMGMPFKEWLMTVFSLSSQEVQSLLDCPASQTPNVLIEGKTYV